MSDQARITSLDALEDFRGDLIRYLERAREALDEASGEVRRTRAWLDVDRRVFWEGELRKRTKRLAQAEQELYSAGLANLQQTNAPQKLAVLKARRSLAEAQAKIVVLRKWRQDFDNRAGFLLRQLDPMDFKIRQHLPKAVFFLSEAIKALQDYAEKWRAPRATATGSPDAAGPAAAPPETTP